MKNRIQTVLFSLLPSMMFLLICWITPSLIYQYSNIGPTYNGQPIFRGHYTDFMNLFMQTLIGLGFLFSIYVIYKSWKTSGIEKFFLSFLVVLMVPVQYLALVAANIELWGK